MNIVVCVKQTPDTAATITVLDGKVSWGDAPLVINPWDEYAVEQALRTKEAHGGKVVALSLGPEAAREALKHALAMGCDEAILVSDPALEGKDSLVVSKVLATRGMRRPATMRLPALRRSINVSKVLASAIQKIGGVDMVFVGRQAVDSDTGVTGPQLARRLGWPALSLVAAVSALDPAGKSITVERMIDEGRQVVRSPLPAVLSAVKELNELRYPSFMGIRKASKATIPVWSAAEVGLASVPAAVLAWPEIIAPPKVETKCELIEGATPAEAAAKLADRLVAEKVL